MYWFTFYVLPPMPDPTSRLPAYYTIAEWGPQYLNTQLYKHVEFSITHYAHELLIYNIILIYKKALPTVKRENNYRSAPKRRRAVARPAVPDIQRVKSSGSLL